MKPANNAPVYAGMYQHLAEIARAHGYCLAVHGSMAKDFDLICVPWTNEATDSRTVVDAMMAKYSMHIAGGAPTMKEHNREVYTLVVSFEDVFIDLSFMPRCVNA